MATIGITYDLNNDYITLNTKEAKICMSYFAVPMDEEGFPMVSEVIKEALATSL